jgi:hypothetical protein
VEQLRQFWQDCRFVSSNGGGSAFYMQQQHQQQRLLMTQQCIMLCYTTKVGWHQAQLLASCTHSNLQS